MFIGETGILLLRDGSVKAPHRGVCRGWEAEVMALKFSLLFLLQIIFWVTRVSRPLLFPALMGTTEATLRMENVDVRDEWQDEDLPR